MATTVNDRHTHPLEGAAASPVHHAQTGMTLGVKAISFIAVILLSVGAVLSWHFLSKAEKGMIGELRARAESLTTNLARSSKWGLLSEDEVILDEIVSDILREDSVLYVAISNSRGEILASRVRSGERSDPLDIAILHAEAMAKTNDAAAIHFHEIDGTGTYHTYMPVESTPAFRSQTDEEISRALSLFGEAPAPAVSDSGDRYGNVQLLVSSKKMFDEIQNSFITGIGLTLLIVLLALAVSYLFCSRVLGPVKAMAAAARSISAGDLSQRIKVRSHDEIGVLAETFNHMSSSLSRMTRIQAERLDALSALHEAGLLINSTLDVEKVIELTLDIVVRKLGYSRALLFLTDWDRGVLTRGRIVGASDDIKRRFRDLEIPLDERGGFCARAAASGKSVLVTDVEQVRGKANATILSLLGPSAFLAVPLMLKDRALGVMAIECRPGHELGTADTALMETLANQMAIAIANAMSFQEIEQLNVNLEAKVRERTGELRKQQARLEEVNEELVKATRHKSEFLANMSHELRTPLNAVIGYSELLQEEMEEQNLSEYIADLGKINSAGKHLLALINDVLDLSKIEAGKMDVYMEDADIAEIVDEVRTTIKPFVESYGNRFTVTCPTGRIRTDITKLRQILFNLLSNAAKFTENGAVSLDVSRIQGDAADEWQFRITDTGIGIAPDKMDRLFEEFSQLDAEVARKHGGTGLGLAISQRFCRMLGGEITVSSQPGQGSTFTVSLPAADGKEDTQKVQAAAGKAVPAQSRESGNQHCDVLVVDDDPAVRDLMVRYLVKEGFRVRTASTGEEGLELARRLHPDAVTLDLLMPGLDGWSVLTQLKADDTLAEIPVVIVTILDNKDMGYTLGAADYLTKPVDPQRLVSIMRQHCSTQTNAPIMIIEDDADSRRLLGSMLVKQGWRVVEAEDAEAGLARLARQEPALILLDLILPGMDGFEFIEAVHRNESWSKIPIVVVTAKDLSPKEHDFLNRSVQTIVRKGVYSRGELLDVVHSAMLDAVSQKEDTAENPS
ncbi:MAG TPA: response regulator [Woeseiaceae bacterium]|nr:response regulator [Woeseiaceae bacterium]